MAGIEGFETIEMRALPYYWQLKIKGEIQWSNKERKCPQCGGVIVYRINPEEHYHCLGCGVNYVE